MLRNAVQATFVGHVFVRIHLPWALPREAPSLGLGLFHQFQSQIHLPDSEALIQCRPDETDRATVTQQ